MSRTGIAAAGSRALHCALERPRGDGLRERELAIHDDDGEVDAIPALELFVTVDRDAPEAEAETRRLALEQRERAGAEPAALALEEHDLDRVHAR